MKHIAALTCLLLTTIATPVLALQGADCTARGEKVNPTEYKDFMKSCLAQAEAPANVKEEERKHKNALCEQNSKNKKLQGNDKADYQSNCMNKNEAAAAASAQPKKVIALSHKYASSNTPKGAPHKAATKKQAAKKQKGRKKEDKKDGKQTTKASGVSEGL